MVLVCLTHSPVPAGRERRKGNTYDGLGVFDAQPCSSRKGEGERGTLMMVLVCLMHSPVPAGRERTKGEHLRWSWCV